MDRRIGVEGFVCAATLSEPTLSDIMSKRRQCFSVVMPANNAADHLSDALSSLAAMDRCGMDMELVFVDDGSTDNTLDVAQRLIHRLSLPSKIMRNSEAQGAGAARRQAIEATSSDIILGVDADDIVRPNRLSDALRVLKDPAVLCGCADLVPFRHGGPLNVMPRISLPVDGDAIAARVLFGSPLWAGVMHMRSSLIGKFDFPIDRISEDWLMAHRLIERFGPQCLRSTGTVVCDHRRHAEQTTNKPGSATNLIEHIWRTVLQEALGIVPAREELDLHANVSPYVFKAVAVPTLSEQEYTAWLTWAQKILRAASERGRSVQATVDYVVEIDRDLRQAMLSPGA